MQTLDKLLMKCKLNSKKCLIIVMNDFKNDLIEPLLIHNHDLHDSSVSVNYWYIFMTKKSKDKVNSIVSRVRNLKTQNARKVAIIFRVEGTATSNWLQTIKA